jgi:hypothetical protein
MTRLQLITSAGSCPPVLEPCFLPNAQTKHTKRCRKVKKKRDNARGGSCGEENEKCVCNFQFGTSVEMRTSRESSVNYVTIGYNVKWNEET